MLSKQPTLLLDPTASHPDNYIRGEVRYIRNSQDSIFCLSKGNFYVNNLSVIDNLTGRPLVIYQDYSPMQMFHEASQALGRPVWAVMRIINPKITEVKIDYQAVGGEYQNLLKVILEIKNSLDPNFKPTIHWNTIIDVPSSFKPAGHAHSFWDWMNLRILLNGIYDVLVAIFASQHDDYIDVYDHLASVFAAKIIDINNKITQLSNRVERYRVARHYDVGDIMPTMNEQVPSNYLYYGKWALLPDVLLYGAGYGDVIGSLIGLRGKEPGDYNALRVYLWQRTDDNTTTQYVITPSKTVVDEGETVTFVISAPGRAAGTAVGWRLTGVGTADVAGELMGTAFLNASGSTTVTVEVLKDELTEGIERMRLEIVGDPSRFAEVQIRDTSTNPSYETYFSFAADGGNIITDAAEGDEVFLIVKAKNIPALSEFVLLYDGSTVNDADFLRGLPASVKVVDGFAAVPFSILKDHTTEGYEALVVYLSNTSSIEQAVSASRLRIYDASQTPTFTRRITSDPEGNLTITNVNEGQSFYLHIITSDIEDGAEVTLSYSGTADRNDFNSTLPTKVAIANNYARVRYDVKADGLSESGEYLDLFLLYNDLLIGEERILINDTSTNGGLVAKFSSNRFGTNDLSWIGEGGTFYLIMSAAGYANGTELSLRYSGQAIAADFADDLPSKIVIEDEVGIAVYNTLADRITEGDETFIVNVLDESRTLASANLTIIDTSKSPSYDLKFTRDQLGSEEVTEIDEGRMVFVHVSARNVNSIAVLGVDVFIGGKRATIANGDVSELVPSTVTLIEGKGAFYIQTRADSTTEGDETIEVRIRANEQIGSAVVATGKMILRDTSKDPTWSIKWTEDEAGEKPWGDTRPLLKGESVYLQWSSKNIPDGTVFWLGYPDSQPNSAVDEDFTDMRETYLTVNGDKAAVRYRAKANYAQDVESDVVKHFGVVLYDNVSMTNRILTAELKMPSPTFRARFSSNPVGNGTLTQANEGDLIYCIVETTNFAEGASLNLEHYINNVMITAGGIDFDDTPQPMITIRDNRGAIGMGIREDAIPDGNKNYQIQVHGDDEALPLAVANVNIIDTSTGGVTENGTYRPGLGAIGSISIAAGVTKKLVLMGGGGSGVSGTMDDPVGRPYDGTDGDSTALRIGATTIAIAGAGEGGLRGREEATPGGTTYINHNALENYTWLKFSEIVEVVGRDAPLDSEFGASSSNIHNIGAGGQGRLTGTGGGSGATVFIEITNNGNALQTFNVVIGQGGLRASGIGQQWNDGAIIVSD